MTRVQVSRNGQSKHNKRRRQTISQRSKVIKKRQKQTSHVAFQSEQSASDLSQTVRAAPACAEKSVKAVSNARSSSARSHGNHQGIPSCTLRRHVKTFHRKIRVKRSTVKRRPLEAVRPIAGAIGCGHSLIYPSTKPDHAVLVLYPGHKLGFCGALVYRVVYGRVHILGFERRGSQFNDCKWTFACSSMTHRSLCFEAVRPSIAKASNLYRLKWRLKEYCDEETFNQLLRKFNTICACIVIRKPDFVSFPSMYYQRAYPSLFHMSLSGTPTRKTKRPTRHAVWPGLICFSDRKQQPSFEDKADWKEAIDCITDFCTGTSIYKSKKYLTVAAVGPKNSGKSTFLKYFLNSMLCKDFESQTVFYYLDCDVGQTEVYLPGCITLVEVSESWLGSAFSHVSQSPLYSAFFGNTSPSDEWRSYVHCVKQTLDFFENHLSSSSGRNVLLVNTNGWIEDRGKDVLMEVLKTTNTDIIVQLVPPEPSSAQLELGSIFLDAIVLKLASVSATIRKSTTYTPAETRGLMFLAYFSRCFTSSMTSLNSVRPYKVQWDRIGVSVQFKRNFPVTELFKVLNCNIVALCAVPDTELCTRWGGSEKLPMIWQPVDDDGRPRCFGFGLVRAVDVEEQKIYVITPMTLNILSQVNLLAVGVTDLPPIIMSDQSQINGAPYVVSMRRNAVASSFEKPVKFVTKFIRVNCSFYFKIGACRHGDKCSRIHNRPAFSQTILLQNFYHNPQYDMKAPDPYHRHMSDAEAQEYFDDFFEEVFVELEDKYGEIEEMNVCDNVSEHLIGNTYVKFADETHAGYAVADLNNRWFNGMAIYAELSPVTDFREACCRQYEMGECTRGGFCNFMHLKPISRELRKELYLRKRQPYADSDAESVSSVASSRRFAYDLDAKSDISLSSWSSTPTPRIRLRSASPLSLSRYRRAWSSTSDEAHDSGSSPSSATSGD